jgi:hypothetical protein
MAVGCGGISPGRAMLLCSQLGSLFFDPQKRGRLYAGGFGDQGTWVGDFDIPPALATTVQPLILLEKYRVDSQFVAAGVHGPGRNFNLTSETGLVSFFGSEQHELMVKMLDGSEINGHHWFFSGAATNVEFDLVLSDWYGVRKRYHNRAGEFASVGDTEAIPAVAPVQVAFLPLSGTATFLLHDRFEISATWRDFSGRSGSGYGSALNDEAGTIYFFSEGNRELLVKVLDGRAINGHWWVYFGGLSNVELRLVVRDLQTGVERVYFNPLGQFASQGDPRGFAEP